MSHGLVLAVVLSGARVIASAPSLPAGIEFFATDAASMSRADAMRTGYATQGNSTYESLMDQEFKTRFLDLSARLASENNMNASELVLLRDHFRLWALAALSQEVPEEHDNEQQRQLQRVASLESLLEVGSGSGEANLPSTIIGKAQHLVGGARIPTNEGHPWTQVEGAFNHNNETRVKEIWGNNEITCATAVLDETLFKEGESMDFRCHANLKTHFPDTAIDYDTLKHTCPEECMPQVQKTCEKCIDMAQDLLGLFNQFIMCAQALEGNYMPPPCTDCYMQALVRCETAQLVPGEWQVRDPHGESPKCKICHDKFITGCALKLKSGEEVCALSEKVRKPNDCLFHSKNNPGEFTAWCPMKVVVQDRKEYQNTRAALATDNSAYGRFSSFVCSLLGWDCPGAGDPRMQGVMSSD